MFREDVREGEEGRKGRKGNCDESRLDHGWVVAISSFVGRCRDIGWVTAGLLRASCRGGRESDPSRGDEVD